MIAILHNIRSLHNVGSIFRTADGAGVEKLYLCGITPAPVDCFNKPRPQLVKVSLGAEKNMTWEKVAQTGRLIDKLKKEGYLVLGVEQDKRSVPYYKVNEILRKASADAKAMADRQNDGVALVVGNEVGGLPRNILDKCDKILEIPMYGKKESLNVAVAFGIVAFYIQNVILNRR